MRNLYVFVIVGIVCPIFVTTRDLQPPILSVYEAPPTFVTTRDVQSQPPTLSIFEVDEHNNVIRPYDRVNNQESEVIIDKLDNLRLECKAYYPVEWIYTGNGVPILSSSISLSTTQGRSERVNVYVASVFISPLKEQHTGSYQCSHTAYLSLSPFIYIYVPGQNLFTSLEGTTIPIPKNDSSILIPCTVSHPRVQVSLKKLDRQGVKQPITKSNDTVVYDPRRGFRVNLNKIEDPEGTFICVARYNKVVKQVNYIVTSEFPRPPDNLLEFKQSPIETCRGESCNVHCESHLDCPLLMNCYTDHLCRDSCTYSIRCGKESLCRVIENVPECYCPPGFIGDPTKECFNR